MDRREVSGSVRGQRRVTARTVDGNQNDARFPLGRKELAAVSSDGQAMLWNVRGNQALPRLVTVPKTYAKGVAEKVV